jgi:hypothetical protein
MVSVLRRHEDTHPLTWKGKNGGGIELFLATHHNAQTGNGTGEGRFGIDVQVIHFQVMKI